VGRAGEIDWRALEGARDIGITAGASAPEILVEEVIEAFRARYEVTLREVHVADERVSFKLPRVLREDTTRAAAK
jgi:4-hydroxy-3-methylbut-2-enyl diphosphate reductase